MGDGADDGERFDAIVIGAGVAGLYQLHKLRELGLSVRVFEAGSDVGGTWYWNRYPGARFDSESYTYAYSFAPELIAEWDWSEHFAAQPETLRYLNFVADKLDLRRDIRFGARVSAATWDEDAAAWTVELDDGRSARARFLITAIGVLSTPTTPAIPGLDTFEGEVHHTARWPHTPVDLTGMRVAVVGTGATGVQVIQEVAKVAGHLSVFQRQPNWCAPLHNGPIDEETQTRVKAHAAEIFEQCRGTFGGFVHDADRRKAVEVSAEEREALYEELYASPGFGIWMGNFRDVLVDQEANDTLSAFVAAKIRQRVDDHGLAEKLIPTNHGFGTRRVPLETGYYEVYNQDNVQLVDLRETPIREITATSIVTTDDTIAVDVVILATGFDAVMGSFNRIDIRGEGGYPLRAKWAEGPSTYLGLQTAGFPNMFTLVGPHNASTFCNMPRCIEQNVDWVTELLAHTREEGKTRIAPREEAEERWTEHVGETIDRMLFSKVDSWFTGINSNLVGRDRRRHLLYAGGLPRYRDHCDAVAAAGYEGFDIT